MHLTGHDCTCCWRKVVVDDGDGDDGAGAASSDAGAGAGAGAALDKADKQANKDESKVNTKQADSKSGGDDDAQPKVERGVAETPNSKAGEKTKSVEVRAKSGKKSRSKKSERDEKPGGKEPETVSGATWPTASAVAKTSSRSASTLPAHGGRRVPLLGPSGRNTEPKPHKDHQKKKHKKKKKEHKSRSLSDEEEPPPPPPSYDGEEEKTTDPDPPPLPSHDPSDESSGTDDADDTDDTADDASDVASVE